MKKMLYMTSWKNVEQLQLSAWFILSETRNLSTETRKNIYLFSVTGRNYISSQQHRLSIVFR